MAKKSNINYELRILKVCEIVQEHYEEGAHATCYKAVWKKHVYPLYPMSYRTFLNYIKTPLSKESLKQHRPQA